MDPCFPTNVSDFKTIAGGGYMFVDKTLMIKDIVSYMNGPFLFTRPRRFGKTMNLSMLECFFDMGHPENRGLFEGLKVSEYPEVMSHFGKYKVVHLDFSMLESSDADDFMIRLQNMISMTFGNFKEISTSEKIDAIDRRLFKELHTKKADNAQLMLSILRLSKWIEQVYGAKAVILIDEYDKPAIQACKLGFFQKFIIRFRSFMEASLKTNQAYKFAIVTGVSHVSMASLFGGLNNLKEFNIFDNEFAETFGFTESEVTDLISRTGLPSGYLDTAREHYGGYRFGNKDMYNPFSIVNYLQGCVRGDCEPKTFWTPSEDVPLIADMLRRTAPDFKERILDLRVSDNILKSDIDLYMDFGKLSSDDPDDLSTAVITLMVTSGYLKPADTVFGVYTVSFPNLETAEAFDTMMRDMKIVNETTIESDQEHLQHEGRRCDQGAEPHPRRDVPPRPL